MKILFLTENFPPERNAAASRVYERACYWRKWDQQVVVITGIPNFPEGKAHAGYRNRLYQVEEMDGIRVVRVKTFIAANSGVVLRIFDFLSFMVTGFLAALFQRRPDVIVATSPQFFTAVAGWAASAVRRVPFVFELSDLWPASITAVGAMRDNFGLRLMERLELFLYRRSDRVVALTQSFKDDLVSRGIPASKIDVILNGVDLSRYSKQPRCVPLAHQLGCNGKFVVGYIGTLGMAHALDRVLDAADLLRARSDIRFMLVGPGAARDFLMAEAKRRGLSNVVFVAAQPKSEMPKYWSLCDVALVHLKDTPLFATVIPSKIFEAMGSGCPILFAGPEGEAARIIRETGSGIVIAPENPQMLSDAVTRLCDDRGWLAGLAEKSYRAAPSFTREGQARDMLVALGQVCGAEALPHVPAPAWRETGTQS